MGRALTCITVLLMARVAMADTKPRKSAPKKPTARELCRRQLDLSGEYERVLTSVPHDIGGAPQCKPFVTGKKFPFKYWIKHDPDTGTAKVIRYAPEGEAEVIIRNVRVKTIPATDQCKALGEDVPRQSGISWDEFHAPLEKHADSGLQWRWAGWLMLNADAGISMTLAGMLVRSDDTIVCYAYFDED